MIRPSRALADLPPYPFAALEAAARTAGASGPRMLRFAVGDPDLPPPPELVAAASEAFLTPEGNRYSTSRGEAELRDAFAGWMGRRFGVRLDPDREVAVLLGSKEGLAHLPRAVLDPGDGAGVPDPGYPAYADAVLLAHARPHRFPLRAEDGWLPDLHALPAGVRLLYLNYPNNPTGAVAERDGLRPALDAARDAGFLLAYDNAYSEVTFGGRRAPSILELPGAREHAVEFHSLSKTLGIPGWRLGFAAGNAEAIRALVDLKSHADSGAPRPLQLAAARLLRAPDWPAAVHGAIAEYGARLGALAEGLRSLGEEVEPPEATLYLWQRVPGGDGAAHARELLERAHILVTPGGAFGERGAGYVRWAATAPRAEIAEAIGRLAELRGARPAPPRGRRRAPRSARP